MSQAPLMPEPPAVAAAVECLGQTFASDEERRAHFTALLRQKLADPAFRAIEGFPLGSDDDILALSDPPYYTACPNPFLADFIRCYGQPYDPNVPYRKEPFAADVSEGKNDPIYNAHSYHTKVPHKAIMRYILHYTQPGDVVLDGFCGTGMTGVAAQMCANPDPEFKRRIEQEWQQAGREKPEWGARRAILGDLSPAATFIAYNYNTPVDVNEFEREAKRILAEVEAECGWMYETKISNEGISDLNFKAKINFVLLSDVFVCSSCGSEIIYWDVAVDLQAAVVRKVFICSTCKVNLTKKSVQHMMIVQFDQALSKTVEQIRQVPVVINYTVGKRRFEKIPDSDDISLIERIENLQTIYWFPNNRMPEGDEARRNDSIGVTHVHHFYDKRNLWILAVLRNKIFLEPKRIQNSIMLAHSATNPYASKMRRFRPDKKGGGPLSGTLYISSLMTPPNVITSMRRNIRYVQDAFVLMNKNHNNAIVTNQSSTQITLPADSVDYIFTDPPFGANFWYSDLNFLWEAWLKVFTKNDHEAVQSKAQHKSLIEYQHIMQECFNQYFRILKPGRWMTVIFSNTKASVWNAIQTAIQQAGFVVANVAALDKQQFSFKAVTTATAVKQDLVISCYKPNGGLETRFAQAQGSEVGAWEFIRSHLRYLPTFQSKGEQAIETVERTPRILYDRLVAYFVQHGYSVPLSAQEFQAGLHQRLPIRDGMYFLPEQIAEYERKRLTVREVQQLEIYVTSEASAIQWLRQHLHNKPQTVAELTPQFMRELNAWPKHEHLLELRKLLEENFLLYDGNSAIPAQIVTWLKKSSESRDLIAAEVTDGSASETNGALATNNQRLLDATRDRWYVPDPNRAIDLEQLRTRSLLKEFANYLADGRKLKQFRTEAIKAGFKQAWNAKDYATIVGVAERLPEVVVQEDTDLLMYYDNAGMRV